MKAEQHPPTLTKHIVTLPPFVGGYLNHHIKHNIMKQTVKRLQFNWHQEGSISDNGCRENYHSFQVGSNGVTLIEEFEPTATTGWNYLIHKKDGTLLRVFNPNVVEYLPKTITE